MVNIFAGPLSMAQGRKKQLLVGCKYWTIRLPAYIILILTYELGIAIHQSQIVRFR